MQMKISYICIHEYTTFLIESKTKSINSLNDFPILQIAKESLQIEYEAISELFKCLNNTFEEVLELLHANEGRLVVTGVGKSGLIAQKMAATFNSTGTPALFLHAGDAAHGDLGSIQKGDIALCLSKSGFSSEFDFLIPYLKQLEIPLIALTTNRQSPLAEQADFLIQIPLTKEADLDNLAPTTSTTLQLIMGDLMAVCLMRLNRFKASDFAQLHPGGLLGKKLNLTLGQMLDGHEKAAVQKTATTQEVLQEITSKRLGATVVLEENRVVGFITDGDLRRMLEKYPQWQALTAADIMTVNPLQLQVDTKALEALKVLNEKKFNHLVVCHQDGGYLGIVHILDFTKQGLKDE